MTISIIKASGIYPSAWYITISGASDTLYAESTDNNMNPTGPHSEIQIGMELGGHNSDYASAPDAWYTNNQWASSSGWNYQTNAGPNGQPSSHNPPNMQMPAKPAPGNNGGRFYTYCCSMADSVMPGSASIPSSAPISPSPVLGLRAIQPGARQANGTMFDTAVVTAYTLSHPIPRSTALGASATPTAVQDVVLGTSQQISQLLGGENMGVPDSTLLYYVKVNGDFAFPTSPDGPEIVSHQAVEVFDATTGNLLIAGS